MSWWDAAVGFGSAVVTSTADTAKSGADAVGEVVDDVVEAVGDAVDGVIQAGSDAVDEVTFGFDEDGNFAAGFGDPSRSGFLVIVDADPTDGSFGHWFAAGTGEQSFVWGSRYASDDSGVRTQFDVSSRSGESSSSVGWDAHTAPTGDVSGSVRGEVVVKEDGEDWSVGGEASLTDSQLRGTVSGERSGSIGSTDYTVGFTADYDDGDVTGQGRGSASGSAVMGTEWSAEGIVDYAAGEVTGKGEADAEGTLDQGTFGADWSARGEATYADGKIATTGQSDASGPLVELLQEVARTHDPDGSYRRAAEEEVAVFVGELAPSLRTGAILTQGRTHLTRGSDAEQALRESVDRLVEESRAIYEDGKDSDAATEGTVSDRGEGANVATSEDGGGDAPAPLPTWFPRTDTEHLQKLTLARETADDLQEERHARVQEHLERAEEATVDQDAGVDPDPRATTLRHLREDALGRRRDEVERLRDLRDQDERSDGVPAETLTAAQLQAHFRGQLADHVSLVVAAAARAEVAGEVLADEPVGANAVSSILLQASAVEVEVAELASDEARLLAGETTKLRLAAARAESAGDVESADVLARAANGLSLVRDRAMTSARAAHREAVTTEDVSIQLADARPGLIADETLQALKVAAEVVERAVADAEEFVVPIPPEPVADPLAEDLAVTLDAADPDPVVGDADQELADEAVSATDESPEAAPTDASADAPTGEMAASMTDEEIEDAAAFGQGAGAGVGAGVEPNRPPVGTTDATAFGRGAAVGETKVPAGPEQRSLAAREATGMDDLDDDPVDLQPVEEPALDPDPEPVHPDPIVLEEDDQQPEDVESVG